MFQKTFLKLIQELKACIADFHIGLKMLHILVADLPQSPLGTQVFKFITLINYNYIYIIAMCINKSNSIKGF